jgi:hypothetical protein
MSKANSTVSLDSGAPPVFNRLYEARKKPVFEQKGGLYPTGFKTVTEAEKEKIRRRGNQKLGLDFVDTL